MKHLFATLLIAVALVLFGASGTANAQLYGGNNYGYGAYGPYVTRPFGYTPFAGSGLYRPQPSLYSPSTYSYYYYRPQYELYGTRPYQYLPDYRYYGGYTTPYYSYYYAPGGVAPNSSATQEAYQNYLSNPSSNSQAAPTRKSSQIIVKVPNADAELWFGSNKTKQTGLERDFVTPELEPGKSYKYQINAKWVEQGVEVQKTRNIQFVPGENVVVDFTNQDK